MDRVESMQVFVSVVELGSFTAAAQAARLSPAMVSKHINALEKRLGSTLLQRTTRSSHLTEIGRSYYQNCKEILSQIAQAEAGAEIMRGKPKGLLTISAPIWFGTMRLAPLVADYLLEYPEVNVALSLTDRFVDLIDEGVDVAIRIGALDDSSYIAKPLSLFELVVCAAPAYLQQQGTPLKPDDLKHHQCLSFTNWKHDGGWKLLGQHLSSKMADGSRFDSNNAQALRVAAIKGLGLILMPKILLEQDLQQGLLQEVLQEFKPAPRPVHAVYAKERQPPPRLTAFVEYLAQRLA